MDVTSLGYRTDLALLQMGGSVIDDRGDHLMIRSPHNPTHWWGNFVLVSGVPPARDQDRWLDVFHAEFPAARHQALGFDAVTGRVDDLRGFAERGLRVEASTVMRATSVHAPARANAEATYRTLGSDDDWAQSVDLRMACNDDEDPATYQDFATRHTATHRATVDGGHGEWWGAFVDGRLVTQMGLLAASPGLARFQSVETHPDFRGRGLAGTLVHRVSRYGFEDLGAETLVMVADPEYLAIRIYRSVGFTDSEVQLQAERAPRGKPPNGAPSVEPP